MRGQGTAAFSVDVLVRALLDEFPELDADRLRTAVERGVARAQSSSLDTEGYRVVDLHLQRAEATEESAERAGILRELAETLEQRGDAERALVVRLAAFSASPVFADLDPLLRLAKVTLRWDELPLDKMAAVVDISHDDSPRLLREMATAWQQVGRVYYAADCLERVLLLDPADAQANEALEVFYRSTSEWPVLIDLLNRRTVYVDTDRERAELFCEIGQIYERELSDDSGALDAYQEADRLDPNRPEVLEAVARLGTRVGLPEEELLGTLERLGSLTDGKPTKERAIALVRAAEIAKNHDWNKAQSLFERARKDDPDLATAVDGLALLLRDRGELKAASDLYIKAADRPAMASERSRWLADAADLRVALGDFEDAKELYRDARRADIKNHRAGVALVELCWDTGSLVELAPILDELCRTTSDPDRLRHYLLQRSKVAVELGEATNARMTLARAVDMDPVDTAARRQLGDLLFDNQEWSRARPLLEGSLEDEDLLPLEGRVELHYRVARCAHQTGDIGEAARHANIVLALQPDYRPALLLRAELETPDTDALLADQLALANTAPVEERPARFATLGDRYAERGDRATAREMYREALSYKPHDHMLLTKSLGLVADEGDWSYSQDLLQRLIDTEKDPKVRARYRHAHAQISRDEIKNPDSAAAMLEEAIEDDPVSFGSADDLELIYGNLSDREPLVRFYYRRLEQMRESEGRPGERLRLWDRLGDVLMAIGQKEDALVAFEVGVQLDPDGLERKQRVADLYFEADPKHAEKTIALHHAVLRQNKRRATSYQALGTLYQRIGDLARSQAFDDAVAQLSEHVLENKIDSLFDGGAPTAAKPRPVRSSADERKLVPLANEDWLSLARIDVDLQLSALFALVAPASATERARLRQPPALPAREHEVPDAVARVIVRVMRAFGLPRPPIYADRDQGVPSKLVMRVRAGALVPALILGPSLPGDPIELAFVLARQLADLRSDRIARLLCPRPPELAQIVELATSLASGDGGSHAARWLTTALHPVELDQARTIGTRLRDRGINPMTSALNWLAATERAADRIGFVIAGDLGVCTRLLAAEPTSDQAERVLDLIWSSTTEEVLGVRARIESWPAPGAPAAAAAPATPAAKPRVTKLPGIH